jgi:hypothetical protein
MNLLLILQGGTRESRGNGITPNTGFQVNLLLVAGRRGDVPFRAERLALNERIKGLIELCGHRAHMTRD